MNDHEMVRRELNRGNREAALRGVQTILAKSPKDFNAHSCLLLLQHYTETDPAKLFQEHLNWARLHAPPIRNPGLANSKEPDRRLRIGYVSSNFVSGHPVSYFIGPVLGEHDRELFQTYGYSNHSNAATEEWRTRADCWREIGNLGDAEAAAAIRADGIDILVDLAGHTSRRIMVYAFRPAPVIVTWIGYPNTTGMGAIDYRITDSTADPAGFDQFYAERLIRLESGFLCYAPPANAPAPGPPPAIARRIVTFGVFQYPPKITLEMLETWAQVLRHTPHSRILFHHCYSDYASQDGPVRNWIVERLTASGIQAERLHFAGYTPALGDHLGFYKHVDIALDTFPYNGTTTTFECLWMGVPVVSWSGGAHAGRVGASVLSRLDLGRLVNSSAAEYVECALTLAANLDELAALRTSLRSRMADSPLLQAGRFTRGLEREYRRIWSEWCSAHRSGGAIELEEASE